LQAALEEYEEKHPGGEVAVALPWLGTLHEQVAASNQSPGGGSVAAYVAALAASLGMMMCNLTKGDKYERVAGDIRELTAQLAELSAELCAAVPKDADSQTRAIDAVYMPRASEAERLARDSAIEEATKALVSLRMRVAQNALETLDLLDELSEIGNPVVFADLAVGAQFALTALEAAALQIYSNLGSIADPEFTSRHRSELDDMQARGAEIVEGIEAKFFRNYPR
jgi:formiminotetrahydrofolate cyclodeaminase